MSCFAEIRNEMALQMMERLCLTAGVTITIIGIRGADNVADCPSRSVSFYRITSTWRVFEEYEQRCQKDLVVEKHGIAMRSQR